MVLAAHTLAESQDVESFESKQRYLQEQIIDGGYD